MTGQTILHYRILEKLGEGGMGVVWKAQDLKLGRQVAIKILPETFAADPDRRAKFAREARAIAALNHPNIVTIYSVEEAAGLYFFTMELVNGQPLTKLIPEQGMEFGRFLELAVPLGDAISAAHQRGIIHRDLKPGNILVSDSGQVKILDFGLAKFRESPASAPPSPSATTASGEMLLEGTVNYMSPEQVRCEPPDHRSDIFSLGIIFYEMLTGRRPFAGKTPAEVMAAILKDTPRPAGLLNPALPHRVGLIVGYCLEKDLRRRLQSALDLRNELDQLGRETAEAGGEGAGSIAVLPFTDMSRERDQEYFCEGMAEEIINALSSIHGLHVASRVSAFQFKGTALDSREIGRRLGVATLLQGSVRKSGGHLRIGVQLIDAAADVQLWSERYDRELSDVFAIQDEIARNIMQALQVKLSPKERLSLHKIPTSDVQAYDYYLRARKFYFQYGRRDMEFALQLFSRAIELDPRYAKAYGGLADCWSYIYLYSDRTEAVRQQAAAASQKAVELDPESAQAQASRGLALSLSNQDTEAEEAFERAIHLDPKLFEAQYFYARHCFARGQMQKAAGLYEQAMRACPEDYQSPLLVAQIYEDLGRPAEATAARRNGVDIAERHLQLNPDDARAVYMAANGLAALGERERAREWAARALTMRPDDSMLVYNVACIYSLLGEVGSAIDALEKAVQQGLKEKGWLEHDSNLNPVRGHPRFKDLMLSLQG